MKRRNFLKAITAFTGLLIAPFAKADKPPIISQNSSKTETWIIHGKDQNGNEITERIVTYPGRAIISECHFVTSITVSHHTTSIGSI